MRVFLDHATERHLRFGLLIVLMLIEAWLVTTQFNLALLRGTGNPAKIEDQIWLAMVPLTGIAIGWLGSRLRLWSWAFLFLGLFSLYWVYVFLVQPDNSLLTRLSYALVMVVQQALLGIFGVIALLLAMIGSSRQQRSNLPATKFACLAIVIVWLVVTAQIIAL